MPNILRIPQMNLVMISGYLANDPQYKTLETGKELCNFRVGVNRLTKVNGVWKRSVNFINVACWGFLANKCGKHLSKGSAVFVKGSLTTYSWKATNSGKWKGRVEVLAVAVDILDRKSTFEADIELPEDQIDSPPIETKGEPYETEDEAIEDAERVEGYDLSALPF